LFATREKIALRHHVEQPEKMELQTRCRYSDGHREAPSCTLADEGVPFGKFTSSNLTWIWIKIK